MNDLLEASSSTGEFSPPERHDDTPEATRGTILLLDDDTSLREVITDFLTDSGYTVVAVQNGAEGIRQMVAQEFSVILCDLMMPTLPGDMFYRAAERIRPRLCERFIFISGGTQNQQASDFIARVNGYVLRKPFTLSLLLDSIALAEVRSAFVSVFDPRVPGVGGAPVNPRADPYLERIAALQQELAAAAEVPAPTPGEQAAPDEPLPSREPEHRPAEFARLPLPAPQTPVLQRLLGALRAFRPITRASALSRAVVLPALALGLVLAGNVGLRIPRARNLATAAVADRQALEAQWQLVAGQQIQAEEARLDYSSWRERAARLTAESKRRGWTGALRVISDAAGPDIALHSVAAHGDDGTRGGCKLLIQGVATGRTPQAIAGAFRDALQRDVERTFATVVGTDFDRLQDEPENATAPEDQQRASFRIILRIGPDKPRNSESKTAK